MTPEMSDELDAFFRVYGAAFAGGDLAAIDALCEYPLSVCTVDGCSEVRDSGFYASLLKRFESSEFAQSQFLGLHKACMGKDGAILVADYRRLKADGSELEADALPFPLGCCYTLRRRKDGWRLVGLADRPVR